MSNYISRMVSRALDTSRAIRPKQMSFFSPHLSYTEPISEESDLQPLDKVEGQEVCEDNLKTPQRSENDIIKAENSSSNNAIDHRELGLNENKSERFGGFENSDREMKPNDLERGELNPDADPFFSKDRYIELLSTGISREPNSKSEIAPYGNPMDLFEIDLERTIMGADQSSSKEPDSVDKNRKVRSRKAENSYVPKISGEPKDTDAPFTDPISISEEAPQRNSMGAVEAGPEMELIKAERRNSEAPMFVDTSSEEISRNLEEIVQDLTYVNFNHPLRKNSGGSSFSIDKNEIESEQNAFGTREDRRKGENASYGRTSRANQFSDLKIDGMDSDPISNPSYIDQTNRDPISLVPQISQKNNRVDPAHLRSISLFSQLKDSYVPSTSDKNLFNKRSAATLTPDKRRAKWISHKRNQNLSPESLPGDIIEENPRKKEENGNRQRLPQESPFRDIEEIDDISLLENVVSWGRNGLLAKNLALGSVRPYYNPKNTEFPPRLLQPKRAKSSSAGSEKKNTKANGLGTPYSDMFEFTSIPSNNESKHQPQVQVKIGSIEVRATPPPKKEVEREQPQIMHLNDYLRKRVNGVGP